MAQHNDVGRDGEKAAQQFLEEHGYIIRHTNWIPFNSKKEIDIVAEKEGLLVIVEVKTRSTDLFEHPEEAVDTKKIRFLVQAAADYLFMLNIDMEVRFDVISVIPDGNSYQIEHIIDAFYPPIN